MTITTEIFSQSHMPDANEAVAEYVAVQVFGKPEDMGPHCTLAVLDDGELIAAVIYHNYQPDCGTVELSTAATDKRWMQRSVLRVIFDTAFRALGVQSCYWKTPAAIDKTIWSRLGAKAYLMPRMFGRDSDGWLYWLTDDDWYASKLARA